MQPYNTPVSQVRALEGKDLKELLELYKEPENSGYDLFAIISAISKKQNQIEVGKAHERQMAMAQGQQQLQQPPVSDQLEAQAQQTVAQERGVPSVMAAHGGVMHTYNNGGIVALRNGGATQYFSNGAPEFGIQSPEDYALDTLRVEEAQKAKRIKELESQLAFLEQVGAPQAADVRRELQLLKGSISPPSTAPTPTPTPTPTPRQDTAAAPNQRVPVSRVSSGSASPARAPTSNMPIPQEMGPSMPDLLGGRRVEQLEGRKRLPEDIVRERAGLAQLIADTSEERRRDIARRRTEEEKERDERIAAAKKFDAQSWFKLAGSIDTRKGKWLGSAGKALDEILTDKQKKTEEAKKAFKDFEASERTEKNLLKQMDILERQRLLAEKTGDLRDVQAIDDKINDINFIVEKLNQDRTEKLRNYGIDVERLDLMRKQVAQAGRDSPQIEIIRNIMRDNPGMKFENATKRYFDMQRPGQDIKNTIPAYQKARDSLMADLYSPDVIKDKTKQEQIRAKIKAIDNAISSALLGSSDEAQLPLYATNPKTKERIMSTDGGKTWKPVQ